MKIEELELKVEAGESLIVVETLEEYRFLDNALELFRKKANVWTWSEGTSLRKVRSPKDFGTASGDQEDDVYKVAGPELIDRIGAIVNTEPGNRKTRMSKDIFLLRRVDISEETGEDVCHALLNWRRQLRNTSILFITPHANINKLITREVYLFPYSLRDMEETREFVVDSIARIKTGVDDPARSTEKVWQFTGKAGGRQVPRNKAYKVQYRPREIDEISASLSGLTQSEAMAAVNYSIRMPHGRLDPVQISRTKKDIVDKSGILEYTEPMTMNDVGGLDALKAWLRIRGRAMNSPKARKYGLPPPKGVLMLGLPGSGNRLTI